MYNLRFYWGKIISLSLLRDSLPDVISFIGSSFLSSLWIYHATSLWRVQFQLDNLLMVIVVFCFYFSCIYVDACKILSLSLTFESLILMYFSVDLISEIHRSGIFFPKWGTFSAIISLNELFLTLSSPSGTTIMCILIALLCPLSSLSYFHSFFFLLFWLDEFHYPAFKCTDPFFHLI